MSTDASDQLPGLQAAVEVVEARIRQHDEAGRAASADGTARPSEAQAADEVRDARHGALVAVRDDLYERITALGGDWPATEVGQKQPPTS